MMTSTSELPSALDRLEEIRLRTENKRLAVFLDYDGTLTPIVDSPEHAVLSSKARETVRALSRRATVAVISGRDLPDVRRLVDVNGIFYAGSHGFEFEGPNGWCPEFQQAEIFLPVLDAAETELRGFMKAYTGALVERKKYSIAVHYRLVDKNEHAAVEEVVAKAAMLHPELRRAAGKKVHELQPGIAWNKGRALLWFMETLKLDAAEALPVYIGDDITDEDAFKAVRNSGIGVIVRDESRLTAASYVLDNTDQVGRFLEALGT